MDENLQVINDDEAAELWKRDIATMIEAFVLVFNCDLLSNEEKALLEKGMKLFAENITSLWD